MTTDPLLELIVGQLFQVTILCVVAGWVTKTVLRDRPFLCYQLWLLVMLKCVTPPLWASHCGVFSWLFQRLTHGSTELVQLGFAWTISPRHLALTVLAVWMAGILVSVCQTQLKWIRIQRRITSKAIDTPEDLQDCLTRLACRLGVRRRIRLVLTTETIGPAVIGVWKPWLVVPSEISAGKTISEIEPILAHELLHIKRGDTWAALLETLVRSVWWFHPEVKRAADAMSRACEMCCDQDVLGQLRYEPRRYADSLVQVIEARCRLQPLLGQPGIRGEQVTRDRLIRIMKGDCPKTRWPTRILLLLLGGLILLPGRSLI